jgi:hypothetical protein
MMKIAGILVAFLLLAVIGGVIALGSADMPAHQTKVEKVIPDERFPR